MDQHLQSRLRTLPNSPGVYLFFGERGRILYVGKARNLKARVRQYLDARRLETTKRGLVRTAVALDVIVTNNEAEALALEATLIQRHEPPYNVRLVDDSSYLYVRISPQTYPKVELVRRVRTDGAWYRGPYPVASAIRATLKEARKIFPWCSYSDQIPVASRQIPETGNRKLETGNWKPCFAYHLGLCPGICAGKISLEEYQEIIRGLQRFLDGDIRSALFSLKARMEEASKNAEYERAARLRDTMAAIEQATTPQHAVTPRRESLDALGLARAETRAVVAVLSVQDGRVTGTRTFPLVIPSEESSATILRSFLLSYLPKSAEGVQEILLPTRIEDRELLQRARVHERARARERELARPHAPTLARFSVPTRGWKKRLLELARLNAEEALVVSSAELTHPAALQRALKELARVLRLPGPPRRIEAYDISNIQGTLPTGSLVVFHDGKPQRSAYRKFKIQGGETPNDVAMMREVLHRRFRRGFRRGSAAAPNGTAPPRPLARHRHPTLHGATSDADAWPRPDLILLDGGKAQLNAVISALREHGLNIPLAALAKRAEELFVPNVPDPIVLPHSSPALFLLQRIRDEAHRFTLGYHQLLRKKRMTRSILEEIPGVGDATRKKLLRAFGSLRGVRTAPQEALKEVVGPKLAKTIEQFFAS